MTTNFTRGEFTSTLTWQAISTRLLKAFDAWDVTEYEIPKTRDVAAAGYCEVNFKLRGTWIPAKCDRWRPGDYKWEHKNFHAILLAIEAVRKMDQRGIGGLLAEIATRVALPPGTAPAGNGRAHAAPAGIPLRTPHEVLGLKPDADLEDAKHRARIRIRELHPDVAKEKYDKGQYDEAMRAAKYFGVIG